GMESLRLEPSHEPTATFVQATVGYQEGSRAPLPFVYELHDRTAYHESSHLQTIQFQMAKEIVEQLVNGRDKFKNLGRQQLFPQSYRFGDEYVRAKVDFQAENPCELGLQKYAQRIIERLRDAIMPDDAGGEPPLMPILNRYQQMGSTADVNFKTTRT